MVGEKGWEEVIKYSHHSFLLPHLPPYPVSFHALRKSIISLEIVTSMETGRSGGEYGVGKGITTPNNSLTPVSLSISSGNRSYLFNGASYLLSS